VIARAFFLGATFATLVSCSNTVSINHGVEAKRGDPAITGRPELISDSDFRAALASARSSLATLAPRSGIFRAVVVTPTRIEAYYWADYDREKVDVFYQNHAQTGYLILQRTTGEWRVLSGREPKLLNLDNAIITG
jgi:hypothetical protein